MSTTANESGACPHCRTGVRFERAGINGTSVEHLWISAPGGRKIQLLTSACPACGRIILNLARIGDVGGGSVGGPGVIYPAGATRPLASEVLRDAPEIAADFAEAVAVLPASRKASAALSRRCLQSILVSAGGAKSRNLADQIDEVMPALPSYLAENVDAVRHVGNFAAHPIKSTNAGEIVDVGDDEAEWQLDTIEQLLDFYYVQKAKAALRRDALNAKLTAAGKPLLKQPNVSESSA